MAPTKSPILACAGLYSTVAVEVAKLTCARSTPGVCASVRSMVRAQAAHVIPDTGRSTRSAASTLIGELDTRAGGPLRRGPPAGLGWNRIRQWLGRPRGRP